MKIKKIQLKNGYKRFFDLTIDLGNKPKRIIALVGPNGCGKSSVFDGMLFSSSRYGYTVGNKGVKDNNYHSINQSPNFISKENVVIEFTSGNYNDVRRKKIDLGKEYTIFSLRSSYRYNSDLKVKELKAIEEIRLNTNGASVLSDLDDKMEENYKRLNVKYNKDLHDMDCKPSEAKTQIIEDLNSAIKNCLNLEITDIGDISDNKGTLYFKKSDQSKEFEFNVLSSGEKEVVDILLDLYLRQKEYDDSIFIIDEPELHINTSIQRKLLIEIDKLIGENCQIWIATHSIGFLRALQEDFKDNCQIIHFEEGKKWASSVQILTPIKKSLANWKGIFEIALDDLTNLISPKILIYCEGKDKPGQNNCENGFDAKVYNNIFGEKHHDTLFISSGGSKELDQRSEVALAILTKAISNFKILVLKDGDVVSGNGADEKARQLYLETNPKNRVLKRREIENYLYDKELLKKYCDKHKLPFDETAYNKEVTDITNQKVKDITGKIKNICNITKSVSPNKFKLNLSELITSDMEIFRELEDVIFYRK